MTPRPTLVTGATGFAGRHLIERLDGPLVAWHRPGGTPPFERPNVQWRPVDLTDRQAVEAAVAAEPPQAIYHLAGAPSVRTSWRNPVPHLRVNVLGTHHLLEAVRVAGSSCRVLVVSSAQVYAAADDPLGEDAPLVPPSPYGLSKLGQEQLALRTIVEDGIDVVVARPFNHVGPGQSPEFAVSHFARQIARAEAGLVPPVLHVGNLDARRDTTDVRDVVAAYQALVGSGTTGRAYNICSGRAPMMRELLETLCGLSTVTMAIETDAERLRPNDVPVIVGDSSRIANEIGWAPVIPLARTLQDTLDSWRAAVRQER